MTRKKFNPELMQRCLDVLDELSQSGLSTQCFAQTQGVSYGQLRAWQSHAPRWRAQLADSTTLPQHDANQSAELDLSRSRWPTDKHRRLLQA